MASPAASLPLRTRAASTPNSYYELFTTFETLYEQVFTDSTTDPMNPDVILTDQMSPPQSIDSKFTYNGIEQWVHTIGYWANPACIGSLLHSERTTPSTQFNVLGTAVLYTTEPEDLLNPYDLMRSEPLHQR